MIDAATFSAILDVIGAGNAVHVAIAEHGVSNGKFFRDLDANPDRAEQYARAVQLRHDRMAEEILKIADAPLVGEKRKTTMIRTGSGKDAVVTQAEEVTVGDNVDRSRLMVESRKWLLSKMAPKKYGDRLDMNHAGANGGPIEFSWASKKPS